MTHSISKGHRVQVIATGATGVIDRERPPQWLYRFRVIDYDNNEELGWHSAAELTPHVKPGLSAEDARLAAKGKSLLLGGQVSS